MFGVYFTTLILSGTRANILISVLLPVSMFLFYLLRTKRFVWLTVMTIVIAVSGITFLNSISKEGGDESSDIKSGHYNSIINVIKSEPTILIWGQGLGSKYFSTGVNDMTVQSELTYLELVRVLGIPITILFLFILIYPIIVLFKNHDLKNISYAIYAYFGYLFIVGTNPLLVSSTGMIVVVVMYALAYSNNLKNNKF